MQIQQRLCHATAFRIVRHVSHFTGGSNQKQVIVHSFEADDSIVKTRFAIRLHRNISMQGMLWDICIRRIRKANSFEMNQLDHLFRQEDIESELECCLHI